MNKIFVYGTLKKGHINYTRYGFKEKTKFICEATLKGAKMYDLGSYPCIVLTDNEKDVVYGEIYEYLDEECEERIKRMEEGAGYVEKEVVVNGQKVKTFIFDKEPSYGKLIEGGVWE